MTLVDMESLDFETFRSPGAEPRIAPFWFWNCEMEPDLVRRQVRQMAEAGVGGFFIHARQGLDLPYLSSEWFARVRLAVETAREHGLQAWLYDEYPYPSGIAGGLLTAEQPELRARVLERRTIEAPGEVVRRTELSLGRLVSAVACPVDGDRVGWERAIDVRRHCGVVLTREQFWRWPMGHIPYNEKRFMADEGRLVLQWTPPAGQWRVFAGIEKEQRGFKYYDCFFDPLQPGAAEAFLRLTHERYAEELGDYFGGTIPGIFTDEIEPPSWSPVIETELRREHDIELAELLPALGHDDHPRSTEVHYRFRQCALRLFQERWETPVSEWCARHGLIWAAEKPTWRPAQSLDVAQPSTDAGHRRIGAGPEPLTAELRANHRAAIAAAEQAGTERVRCECFHSMGWGATLQDQKWQIDWLTAQGVNRFTPHAFYATSSGLAKHDAAPSFFTETPAWTHFRLLADYTARLSLAMSSGREVAPIAVLHPTESLWGGGPAARRVRENYEWLMNALLAAHFGFHLVDSLALLRARAGGHSLALGRARYEILLVPPLSVADRDTERAIQAVLAAGLPVLMAEPLASGTVDETDVAELAKLPGVTLIRECSDWLAELEQYRTLSITDESITDEDGREAPGIWALRREAGPGQETGGQQLLFVANTTDREAVVRVELAADVTGWEQWSLEDGSAAPCLAEPRGGRSRLQLRLAPYGSALLAGSSATVAVPAAVPGAVALPEEARVLILPTEGAWELALAQPNALRLNQWRIVCDRSQDWSSADRSDDHLPEVPALPLRYRDQVEGGWRQLCERSGDAPVWYRRWVSCEMVPADLRLLVEQGAIAGQWSLFINGVPVSREAFLPLELHGARKMACEVASLFRRGDNLIALRVDGAPEMGGLRTPLHLIGSFALGEAGLRTLVELPGHAAFNNLAGAGLPHFSGAVTYRRQLPAGFLAGVAALELPPGFDDIAEVALSGQSLGVRAWSPYRWALPSPEPGAVELRVTVTNTLLPFMEGQRWDAAAQMLHHV